MDEYDYADPGDPTGSYGEEYDNQAELEELLNSDEDPDIKIGSYLGDNMNYFEKLAEDAEMLEALDNAGALDGDEINALAEEANANLGNEPQGEDSEGAEDIDLDNIDPAVLDALDEEELAALINDDSITEEALEDMSGEELANLLQEENVDEEALAQLIADNEDAEDLAAMEADAAGEDDDLSAMENDDDLSTMEADEEISPEEAAELEKQSAFHYDVLGKAYAKTAGLSEIMNGLLGNNGTVNTPLMALGGAGLGAMAGRGLGHGALGTIGGALLGGALGGIGSNAINSQNDYQNVADMAMINNVNSSLNANMQSDMAQNQAIMQTNETVGQLVDAVNGLMAQQQAMAGGMPMDPSMMGGDPSMMGGQPPMDPSMMGGDPSMMGVAPQGGPGMMPPPPPPPAGPANNGLGQKQGSYKGDPIENLLRRFRTSGY